MVFCFFKKFNILYGTYGFNTAAIWLDLMWMVIVGFGFECSFDEDDSY